MISDKSASAHALGLVKRARNGLVRLWRANRVPFALWAGWRIALFLIPFWAGVLFPAGMSPGQQPPVTPSQDVVVERAIRTWTRYDGGYYTSIARYGYAIPEDAAFYPLYPATVRLLATTTRLSTGEYDGFNIAAIIVSSLASLAAFCLLYHLTRLDDDADTARRAVLYMAIWPMAFFFAALYTESLFVAVTLAAFWCARRWRWSWSLTWAALAVLTRNQGVIVVVALAVEYLQQAFRAKEIEAATLRRDGASGHLSDHTASITALGGVSHADKTIKARQILWFALPVLAWAAWAWFNARVYGDALAFVKVQGAWGKIASDPFTSLGTAWQNFSHPRGDPAFVLWPRDVTRAVQETVDLPFTVAYTVLTIAVIVACARGRMPLSYGVYSVGVLFLPLFAAVGGIPLQSMPRYGLVLFPIFIVLARWGGRWRSLDSGYVVLSGALLGLFVARFTLLFFVA